MAVSLDGFLSPAAAESAERLGNAWIKSLRHADVGGRTLRDRFTHRGDSLWWFAELYLHKQRTAAEIYAAIAALETYLDQERPARLAVAGGTPLVRAVAAEVARVRGLPYDDLGARRPGSWTDRMKARAVSWLHGTSPLVRRLRGAPAASLPAPGGIVALVHTAFWRDQPADDTYVGPVVAALESRIAPAPLAYVGVGPSSPFRVRNWRRRFDDFRAGPGAPAALLPIETFRPSRGATDWRRVWRDREAAVTALVASPALRQAARFGNYDLWPLVGRDLVGIASEQFPWSARVMDEAGAMLDALRPSAVVTYAEAGGWGRAVILEARRRGVPVAGLQHGFISRHWLNYQHEPDELAASPQNPDDAGCPLADLTLVYDRMAHGHLLEAGRYPAARLAVTGNPRLDAMAKTAASLDAADIARAKAESGARPDQHLVLLAAKRIPEFDATFAALMRAAAAMPGVHLAVRPHPAETAEPYERLAAGAANVRIVPLSLNPVALIRASRLVATINSTVAIEAMVLGVPALAMRLPNYLSPFVEAGAMAGTTTPDEVAGVVARLVESDPARDALDRARREFIDRFALAPDGRAADRAAEAVVALAEAGPSPRPVR